MIEERVVPAVERYVVGQRIRARGAIWEIEPPLVELEGTQVLALRDVANPLRTLKIISSVEEIATLRLRGSERRSPTTAAGAISTTRCSARCSRRREC
jgi:hypothetical protein